MTSQPGNTFDVDAYRLVPVVFANVTVVVDAWMQPQLYEKLRRREFADVMRQVLPFSQYLIRVRVNKLTWRIGDYLTEQRNRTLTARGFPPPSPPAPPRAPGSRALSPPPPPPPPPPSNDTSYPRMTLFIQVGPLRAVLATARIGRV